MNFYRHFLFVLSMLSSIKCTGIRLPGKVQQPVQPEVRDVTSYASICRLACMSKCLHSRKLGEECAKKCPIIDTQNCSNKSCLSKECIKLTETSVESIEKLTFRAHFGHLDVEKNFASLRINWTLPQEIFPDELGPLLFFLEEKRDQIWAAYQYPNFWTFPNVDLTKQCEYHHFRFAAVNSGGLVGISPEQPFIYDENSLLPVTNISLTGLEFKNQRVNGLLSWHLAKGISPMDVEKYTLQPMTTYCEMASIPAVKYNLGTLSANAFNMRNGCSYEFNVSFTTVCGQRSGGSLFETKKICQKNMDSVCLTNSESSAQGPDLPKVTSMILDRNSTDIWLNVSWNPPTRLGASSRIIGYEIWWGAASKTMEDFEFYDFSDNNNITVITISTPNITNYTLHGLDRNIIYGLKIAAIGNVWHNVSQVLRLNLANVFSQRVLDEPRKPTVSTDTKTLVLSIVCPIAILFILLAIGAVFYRRYKLSRHPVKLTKRLFSNPLTLCYMIWQDTPKREVLPPRIPDRWELPRSRIELGDVIGKGAFGEVVKATIQGTILVNLSKNSMTKNGIEKHMNYTVAVKQLPVHTDAKEREAFLQEIQIMKDIGYHRHLVSLIGCCVTCDPIFLVEEFCPLGDLRMYLSANRKIVTNYSNSDFGYDDAGLISTLTFGDLLSFARQIAIGMEYIHRKGYVHRDLAARNILLVDQHHVKIGDFGLTRFIYENRFYTMQSTGKLPVKWMAIESIFDLTFTAASDVWAFGIVLFEIITLGGTPYPTICNKDLLMELRNGYRMECPDNCPPELYALMLKCWQIEPEMRPSFVVLQRKLEEMLERCTGSESYLQLDANKDYYLALNSQETLVKKTS